jgi:hypothetical protein
MKRFVTMLLAAVAVTACFDDPTSDLRGGAAQIRLSRSQVFLNPAGSIVVEGTLLDAQGNTVPGFVTFETADASIATVAATDTLEGNIETSAEITGVTGGATYVRATSGGVRDSIYVVVVPQTFTGTISPATTTVGTEITVSATALIGFDPDEAAVTVGGLPAIVTSVTSSELKFVAPTASGATVTIDGLLLLGNIPLGSLDATTTITVTETDEPANDAPSTGGAITMPSAVGDSVIVFASEGGSDVDDYFTVVPGASGTYQVTLDWPSGADIDMALLGSSGAWTSCNPATQPGGDYFACSAATGANPEVATATLTGGTTYRLYVNLFDDNGEPQHIYRLIIKRTS